MMEMKRAASDVLSFSDCE